MFNLIISRTSCGSFPIYFPLKTFFPSFFHNVTTHSFWVFDNLIFPTNWLPCSWRPFGRCHPPFLQIHTLLHISLDLTKSTDYHSRSRQRSKRDGVGLSTPLQNFIHYFQNCQINNFHILIFLYLLNKSIIMIVVHI